MRIAILPVFPSDVDRGTTLTKAWLQRAGDAVASFFNAQSGGRMSMRMTAFDWRRLEMTQQQWLDDGLMAGRTVYKAFAAQNLFDEKAFDHFIVLIDDGVSTLGVTPNEAPETSLIGARGVTPALIAHEIGHRLGAGHTFLETADGLKEYDGPFCIMGREGAKHSFSDAPLVQPTEGATEANAWSGPGVCFPNLVAIGWADPQQHALEPQAYSGGGLSSVIELSALDGAPPPSRPLKVACIILRGDRYIVEYRSPASGFDRAVPNATPPNRGDLVVYRSPPTGALQPVQTAAVAARPGAIVTLGDDTLVLALAERTGGVPGTRLRLTVLQVDPAGRKITLRIEARVGHAPQYERTEGIFDFLQWAVVGRELGKDERMGPMATIKTVLEIEHLERLRGLSHPAERAGLDLALRERKAELRALTKHLG